MSSLDNYIQNTRNDISPIGVSVSAVPGPARRREDYTVGWICALPIELAAARAMLDERHKPLPQMANDSNVYEYGSMYGHNIVIACLPSGEYGIASATSVAKDMLRSFSIRVGLMVGIGGGIPKHGIHLGDVVISQPSGQLGGVVQYDFGKSITDGKFIRTGHSNSPTKALLTALSSLRSDVEMHGSQSQTHIHELARKYPIMKNAYASSESLKDILFKAEDEHDESGSCESCLSRFTPLRWSTGDRVRKVHYGLIASGNQVMKDAKRRDEISNDMGENVLCFEMEAAGLMNDFPCLVIRGICDYSDSHKNKEWQRYAAATAAAEAKELLRHVAREEVLESCVSELGHFIIPFGRNSNFVGRETLLEKVIAKSDPNNNKNSCQRVAITGLGGVGKTQLALEAAFRIRESSPDCSIFWVPAINSTSFESAYREIGKSLGIAGIGDDKADVKVLVQTALSGTRVGNWLMIIDNADDTEMFYGADVSYQSSCTPRLEDYLPFSFKGSILLTTRKFGIASKHAGTDVIDVQEMTDAEAQQLLEKSLLKKVGSGEREGMIKLLELLTNLPLAIRQAAAFMNGNKKSVSTYINTYMSCDTELIKQLSKDFEDHGRYKRFENVRNPVATTWWISFEHIIQSNELAKRYLYFCFCVAAQGIPRSLLPPAPDTELEDAIGLLEQYAFITSHEDGKYYNIHRLVQLAGRNWLHSRRELSRWSCEALEQVTEMFPFFEHEKRDECAIYLPHALHIYDFQDFPENITRLLAILAHNIGEYFLQTGKYSEAKKMYRQALELSRTALDNTHPSTLTSMNNLAEVYRHQGQYTEAEALQQQTLELKRTVLGDSHPSTLDSMNNLAIVYRLQGKYTEAEALQQQTLELKRTVLGDTHPSTLNSMNNLAIVYELQGKYTEAEALQQQTLELKRTVLGDSHPSTLDSMNNLAIVYGLQGKYTEAEALHQQTLELKRTVLGDTHPSTLDSMNNLTIVYRQQGKNIEAEALQQEIDKA